MDEFLLRIHLITVLAILGFKLAVLLAGVFITWMGFKLMVLGITGEFKFSASFRGVKSGLASASPGLLFLLLGVFLLAIALFKDKPFETGGANIPERQKPTAAPIKLPDSPP
ncbi:MAG: hypothetical protein QOH88_3137 [Verrucomicrobiota bacterium]